MGGVRGLRAPADHLGEGPADPDPVLVPWQHEPCFFGWIRGKKPEKITDQFPRSVWEFTSGREETSEDHPTAKPVELWEIPIAEHTRRGDLIYEPFSGSGTALVAAERTGRICYAAEIQPSFVAVALERLREIGLEPRLVEGEVTGA